jgi:cellulose synthase/poly-beta-1,6-N-acetylglucosamine synthase-like glycosyltransferase
MMILLFGVSAGLLLYAYAGYPLLLWLIVRLRGERPVRHGTDLPSVTFVISAYNEAAVIGAKLDNALGLDYPRDRLQVVVISDASNDGTDEIVLRYAERGVRLERQPERRGKTAGINRVIPKVAGEVVVFSDANAMYAPDALRMLVRNFSDPQVGCVTGEARYTEEGQSAADAGERAYWTYEIQVKRLETAVGSMVGGDGAIYAIRKELWQQLPENAINDFLNPLQIVAKGWRAVYEPLAVCFEETAGGVRSEYRRRIRIVSRSWRAVFQAPAVLNPFRVGFFTVSVISHKILRWLSGLFGLTAVVSASVILVDAPAALRVEVAVAAVVLSVVALLYPPARRVAAFGIYFAVITLASVVGLIKGTIGSVSGTWSTPREAAPGHGAEAATFAPGSAVLVIAGLLLVGAVVLVLTRGPLSALNAIFWFSIAVLVYVYAAYPLVMTLLRPRHHQNVRQGTFEPFVCLFITANDEASVIEAKLRNALALDYPKRKLEIVVASDGSVDGTNEIVSTFAADGVKLLAFPERRGKIAAINDGMAAVTAEVVVFSDANTFLDPGSVRALVSNLADDSVGAVSGDVILEGERAALGSSEDLYYRYERWLQACESEIGTMVGVDGALYAIRRELFVPPPVDTILDDMAIPMAVARSGRRVIFEPRARAHERGSETATEEFVRKSRVVAGAVQFLRRPDSAVPLHNRQLIVTMLSHKALRWLSPVFALLAFATSTTLALYSNWFLVVASGQLLFMLAGAAGCYPPLRRLAPISIAHYFWLVQAAAAVGFTRGLLGQQPVAWRRFERAPVELV